MRIQVVWPKPWMGDDFAAAGLDVTRHTGFDVVEQTGPIWWATEIAARSMAEYPVKLTAPNWIDFVGLSDDLLGRQVWAASLGALAETSHLDAFVKPADSKIVGPGDTGKAMVARVDSWAEACLDHGVPKATTCLVSEPVHWHEEWRVWTDGVEVCEASKYQSLGATWDGDWPVEEIPYKLARLARQAVAEVGQPCTIDIGLYGPNWAPGIVELNPAWSSGPYTSDLSKVYRSIAASYEWALAGRGRQWRPDAWLRSRFLTDAG